MAEQVIETNIQGGKATAAPPLGPALGPTGVNIGEVVKEINQKTADMIGMTVPVKVVVNTSTKTFTISIGTPPVTALIKKEGNIQKGVGAHAKEVAGDITFDNVIKIAKIKGDKMLGRDLKSQVKEVLGTARSMGVTVDGLKIEEVYQKLANGDFDDKLN
jgi:large subunit ribosomal protein L11